LSPNSQHKLPPQPWMQGTAVTRVLELLGAGDIDVRVVGGAVRNAVMGLAVSEIDIATPELPAQVIARLTAANVKAVPTGLDHGTVMAVVGAETFEITTLRRDTACDGRHADVAFTTDWQEDARRRDFTVNAMSLRPDGSLFDYHGGVADARAGRIRFVGEASDRIREDYLRILRFFRFFALYGQAAPDAATLAACRAHADGLTRLSAERIHQELEKTLSAARPLAAVTFMAEAGVLTRVLPEAKPEALARFLDIERQCDWLLRLAALLPNEAAARSISDRFKLSNAARERLSALLRPSPVVDPNVDPASVWRALYRLGGGLVADRLTLAWARAGAGNGAGSAPWRALLKAAESWTPKTLPVDGTDVLALGVPPGPAVGRILSSAEEWWIRAGFAPDREETLGHLRHLVGQYIDIK